MSLDLSSLLAQAPLRKLRRPVPERMLSIQVRDVRPLVAVNQQTVLLPPDGSSPLPPLEVAEQGMPGA